MFKIEQTIGTGFFILFAGSQTNRVDFHMISLKYDWEHAYVAAVLETDDEKLVDRIAAAESRMLDRVHELNMDSGGSPEERFSLATALVGMHKLRFERLDHS